MDEVQQVRKKKKKKKKQSPVPYIALSVVFFAVFAVCTIFTVRNLTKKPGDASPLLSSEGMEIPIDYEAPVSDLLGELSVNTGDVTYLKDMLDCYKPLYAYNSETVGWLKIPNTAIDTVVVQNPEDDGFSGSYHYLRNDFYGTSTRYGNAFLDYRCKKYDLSANTILYGHTTDDGQQVFSDLSKYENPEFFKANPIIEYSTLYNHYKWKVCAVFVTSINSSDDNGYVFDYIYPTMGPQSMAEYIEQLQDYTMYYTGVEMLPTDKLLSLSTCSYDYTVGGTEITSRLVVVARMLRDGESEEIDPSLVSDNADFRRPQRWYDLMGQTNPYKSNTKWKPSAN